MCFPGIWGFPEGDTERLLSQSSGFSSSFPSLSFGNTSAGGPPCGGATNAENYNHNHNHDQNLFANLLLSLLVVTTGRPGEAQEGISGMYDVSWNW